MINRILLASFFILSFSTAIPLRAQMDVDLVNSGEILYQADLYNSLGKYAKAESLYKKVGRNDTNYAVVLRNLAYTYSDDKEDSLAYVTALRGKELDSEYGADFYNIIGMSLKEMGKFDTALKALDEGIRLYPFRYHLYYQKGMTYVKMKKYPEAQACFEKAIELNPYHANSHYQLGKTCAEQGRLIPAVLSYEYYLMLDPNSERSAKVVTELEDLYTGDSSPDPDLEVDAKDAGDDCFNDLKELINSKIAFSPTYKNKTKINLKMAKQLQALLEKIHYEPNTGNWWMEFYVPFFVELQQKQYLAPFASLTLISVADNPSVLKSVKKNKKKIGEMATWAGKYIKEHTKHPAKELLKGSGKKNYIYYDNHIIAGAGEVDDKDVENGEWIYFYMRSGHLLSKGNFVNGKREGEWNWYFDDGTLREKTNYKNGLREGPSEEFYLNGLTSFKCTYSKDKIEGEYSVYTITGAISEKATMKGGQLDGTAIAYYANGSKKADINYSLGKANGDMIFYTIDGKMYQKVAHANDKQNGKAMEYYTSGTVKSEGENKNDAPFGPWKYYWDNGKVLREGSFKEKGLRDGEWKEYFRDGTLSVKTMFSSGKFNGVSEEYDTDGKLYVRKVFSSDKLKKASYFDKTGKVIAEYNLGKETEVVEYYANGKRAAAGTYYNGERGGDWKVYAENGGWLKAKEHYEKGALNGERIEYFESGKKSSQLTFKNGDRDGYLKSYFQNGTLQAEGWFVEGDRQGDWYEYNQRGVVISHRYYMNNDLYGYQDYFDEKGRKDEEAYYKKTNLWKRTRFDSTGGVSYAYESKNGSGTFEYKFLNGQTMLKQEYKNGVLEGPTVRYTFSGTKILETTFINGMQHGKRSEYSSDSGKLTLEENMQYDDVQGPALAYWDNGNKRYEENYYAGDQDGVQKYYHENGTLMKEGTWQSGSANGVLNYYSGDGQLAFIRYYKDGNILGYSYLDKDGKAVPMIPLEDASGKFTAYYQNGNKSMEGEYSNGRFNGKLVEYYPDGKIAEDENYLYGDYEGDQKYYYPNGNIRKELHYTGDELDGTAKMYYENGQLEHSEFYVLGDAFGNWLYYNEAGLEIKRCGWYDDIQLSEFITQQPALVPTPVKGKPKSTK